MGLSLEHVEYEMKEGPTEAAEFCVTPVRCGTQEPPS